MSKLTFSNSPEEKTTQYPSRSVVNNQGQKEFLILSFYFPAKTVNLQLNLRKARQGHINLKKLQKTTIIIIKAKCTITKGEWQLLTYPWPLNFKLKG